MVRILRNPVVGWILVIKRWLDRGEVTVLVYPIPIDPTSPEVTPYLEDISVDADSRIHVIPTFRAVDQVLACPEGDERVRDTYGPQACTESCVTLGFEIEGIDTPNWEELAKERVKLCEEGGKHGRALGARGR